jgi:protease IV
MTLTADEIIERRRMRRKVAFWRVAAFLLVAGLIVAIAGAGGVFDGFGKGRDHIARVKIDGFISDDRDLVEMLQKIGKANHVQAVILDISSPGGSTVGGEVIYDAVRKLAQKKPVVASVGTLAASAAYMIACGTDQIVARRSSIVGSIGVLFQYGDVSELLNKIGVKVDAIKSSPMKAEPSPFAPASEEAKQMIGRVITDSYEWFVALVAERRKLEPFKARQLADGSIFTGAQGLANGLVDQIGGEDVAKDWLEKQKSVAADLKIIDWVPKRERDGIFGNVAGLSQLIRFFGGESAEVELLQLREILSKSLFLDGLVSVMQTSQPAFERLRK